MNVSKLVTFAIPPVLGYFAIATLAVAPQTFALRASLWPIVTLLAFRAGASVDTSLTDPDQRYVNTLYIFTMIFIVSRTLEWTLPKEPLARHTRPVKTAQSILMDALDLALSLRGIGWEWSRGVYVPRETRPTDRRGFTIHVVRSLAAYSFFCGVLHKAIRSFSPTGIGAAGGSIYDDTLPFHLCHLRASIISLLSWFGTYTFIQECYHVCTLVAVLFLGHAPEQWPPAFDAPWRATSISMFWGRGWHQFFRRLFIFQGGIPLDFLFGRAGFVFGTFLSSAVLHYAAMATLAEDWNELEAWRIVGGFCMFAPIVLAENAFKRLTGRRVEGFAGWVWMAIWFILCGTVISDGFARAGMFGRLNFTELVVPRKDIIERLVERFDAWLHTA